MNTSQQLDVATESPFDCTGDAVTLVNRQSSVDADDYIDHHVGPEAMRLNLVYLGNARHIGQQNGSTASDLVRAICGTTSPGKERRLRHLVQELREQGHHVCAHPQTGYFLAATDEELDQACEFLYGRAMCSLKQISAMRRVSLPDLRGQLRLPT